MDRDALCDLIEKERGRLERAHVFLSCLLICLEEPDRDEAPDYSVIVATARELLNTTINNLDSVNLP